MRKLPLQSHHLACLSALLLLATSTFATANETVVSGTIKSFECGDNCYLTVISESGEEHVGLCAAPECGAWNDVAEMPQEMVGRHVVATTGTGVQYDGSGNRMGDMLAFSKLEFTD